MQNDSDVLRGVLIEDAEVPYDAERLRIPQRRCVECAARRVRCFHDDYEVAVDYQEGKVG